MVQESQLGTGHAARAAESALADFDGTLVIANGDMPLVTPHIIQECLKAQTRTGLAMLAFQAADPAQYGRVLLSPDGFLARIVEYKDASEPERGVSLCNAGDCYAADAKEILPLGRGVKEQQRAKRSITSPTCHSIARTDGVKCAIAVAEESLVLGVNSRAELAAAETMFQNRMRAHLLADGVGMAAPETVFFAYDTKAEADVEIEPFVVFGPGVTLHSGARIRSHSHVEGAEVATGAIIGPYARLRPGAKIGEGAHIGNFVEVKNTLVEKGATANHLSYLGDAKIGAGANIGAGTITCNDDGCEQAITEIGAGAFIGSNTALVAPVKVGAGAITAAGSVITKDVAPDALAIARGVLTEKPGWAKAFREKRGKEKK